MTSISRFLPDSAPSLIQFEEMADVAFHVIPLELRRYLDDVVLRIEDFPDEETCREMELESPFELLGLYRGIPLDQKSLAATAMDVDMIFLYRRPILDYWAGSGEDLSHIVRHVLIHEIGHHFGFSDDHMDRIERQAAERATL